MLWCLTRGVAADRETPTPEQDASAEMSDEERKKSAAMMRVNYMGEVAAQALYRGQSVLADSPDTREFLLHAADEEIDHLRWCEQRIEELGGRLPRSAPLWYAGAWLVGLGFGSRGDRRSLGFVEETEKQVYEHLVRHIDRLPSSDAPSRAVLEQMCEDEQSHGVGAHAHGAELPSERIKSTMAFLGNVMVEYFDPK